MHLLKTFI